MPMSLRNVPNFWSPLSPVDGDLISVRPHLFCVSMASCVFIASYVLTRNVSPIPVETLVDLR